MYHIPYKQHNHIGYCVYYLMNKNKIVYIGCTFNLGKRLGEHSQWLPIKSRNDFDLGKKEFTHYFYISFNNQRKARSLEMKEIRKYKPKYNDRKNYKWIFSGKKYVMYKICRDINNRERYKPNKFIYNLMTWERR